MTNIPKNTRQARGGARRRCPIHTRQIVSRLAGASCGIVEQMLGNCCRADVPAFRARGQGNCAQFLPICENNDRNRPILGDFGPLSPRICTDVAFSPNRQELGDKPLSVRPNRPEVSTLAVMFEHLPSNFSHGLGAYLFGISCVLFRRSRAESGRLVHSQL